MQRSVRVGRSATKVIARVRSSEEEQGLRLSLRRGQRAPGRKERKTEGKPVRWVVVGWLALSGGNLLVGRRVRRDQYPFRRSRALRDSLLALRGPRHAVAQVQIESGEVQIADEVGAALVLNGQEALLADHALTRDGRDDEHSVAVR